MIFLNDYFTNEKMNDDKWIIPNHNKQLSDYVFYFDFCPNDWFKTNFKKIVWESISIKKIKLSTIHRYHITFKKFFEFINSQNIHFDNFEKLQNKHIEMFIFYLQQENVSKSTISSSLSSLKWFINHGKTFGYKGFPIHEVFSGEEFKMLKIEDTLKTKIIPGHVMNQIEKVLKKETNILIKSLLEIGIDTGIRLNECLSLTTSSLTYDFTDKPILHVISEKNDSERFIPVSNRVKRAIESLTEYSKKARKHFNTDCITVYISSNTKKFYYLRQDTFRTMLLYFIKRHNITDLNGELYHLKYHAFRHTLGTSMINKGMSIFEIQDYLGHDSLHSTSIYAKIENPTLHEKYKEIGFIGKIIEEPQDLIVDQEEEKLLDTLHTASLPDGICSKPIDNEGKICAKYNMCLLCPKFITTPKHLDIHKNHLERIQNDKQQYMTEEYIGSLEHLEKIEYTLETIISQLEEMNHVK